MCLWIDALAQGGVLLIIHDFVEQRIHEDDDLDIFFNGLLEYVLLGLEHRVALLVFRLQEVGIARQQLVVKSAGLRQIYVLM